MLNIFTGVKMGLIHCFMCAALITNAGYAKQTPCRFPLGIQSGSGKQSVQDQNMTASSSKDSTRSPHHARLNGPSAWCNKGNITTSWIKVSFGKRQRVTEIVTQGSMIDFTWVTRYRVEYRQNDGAWKRYAKDLVGNSIIDYPAGKMNKFEPALIAYDVRVHPLDVNGVTSGRESVDSACLRIELFGCIEYDSCPPPGEITNGWHSNSTYRHDDRVRYFCNHGYRLKGSWYSKCHNGKWQRKKPFCEVKCPSPGVVHNGNYTVHSSQVAELLTFNCSPGFDLVGSARATCVAGKWNRPKPQCLARCRHPGVPAHGLIEMISFRHGGKARFRCDLGFSLTGSAVITCSNGQWRLKPPTCKGGCSDPGKPSNGSRQGNDFSNGRSVRFQCLTGFSLDGASRVTCKTGRWSAKTPVCRASCQDPGIPIKGMRSGDDFWHTGRVYYFCHDGYAMVGKGDANCFDGKWSSPAPKCVVACANPGILKHGKMIGEDFTDNKTVRFTCNKTGYDMFGSTSVTCKNGTWNDSTPSCRARCKHPRVPANAIQLGPVSILHGSKASFRCKPGFKLVGFPVVVCNDGKWNDSMPSCMNDDDDGGNGSASGSGDRDNDCSDPGIPQHGGRHGNGFTHGQRITFFCNRGYMLFGPSRIICDNGMWSSNLPTCGANCKDPGIPRNGGRHGDSFSEGQRVGFFCSHGYVLEGPSEIMCVAGDWSAGNPVCKANGCKMPSTPPNAKIYGKVKSYYAEQDNVFYLCDRGFYIVGRRDRQCQKNTWSRVAFRCISNGCGDPGTPQNGNKIGLVYRVLRKVYYTCLPGYSMIGPPHRMCQTNGTWTGFLPKCVPTQCPSLPVPQHGVMLRSKATHLSVSRFMCTARGYQLVGSKIRICQANGTWSGNQPYCTKVTCVDPGTPFYGSRVTHGRYSYKDSIMFSCNTGYTLQGSRRIVCLDDGTWSDATPKCIGSRQCPLNWKEFNGRCYLFKHATLRKQIWKRLQKRCRKNNARLLSIKDSQEWNFVKRNLKVSVPHYAIGLHKSKNGDWRWTGGGRLRYPKWAMGGNSSAKCVAIRGSDGLFIKTSCRARLTAYICKKNK